MSQRFFVESPPISGRAELTGDEAYHLARVMRASAQDEVILFDGSGAEFLARIARIGRTVVELEVVERRPVDREQAWPLTLAVALPKGDRQKWLVEKATELGVARLVPLITERGVARPSESTLGRLRRGVIEASKQCGRNRLMEIAEPVAAAALFRSLPDNGARLIADPAGTLLNRLPPVRGGIIAAIGPEGGFTEDERSAAAACGWQPASLGNRILRVETVAVAIAAWSALR